MAISGALFACLIWAGNFVVARGVHELIPPFALSFWRWIVALIFVLPMGIGPVRRDWKIITSNLSYIALMGVIGVAGFSALIYSAGHTSTASNLAIISSTTPIFTLLIAGLVGEDKLTPYRIIGAVLACAGALVVISRGDAYVLLGMSWHSGDVMVTIAALIWASWSVALHFKPEGLSNMAMMVAIICFGLLALAPFYIWENSIQPADIWNVKSWLIFLYIGIGASIMGWMLWQYSVEVIGSVRTSLIYYSIPLFSSVLAMILLGEQPQFYHIAGFMLVVSGIVVSNRCKL